MIKSSRKYVSSPLQNLNIQTMFSDSSNVNTFKNANTPTSNLGTHANTPNHKYNNNQNLKSNVLDLGLKTLKKNEEL